MSETFKIADELFVLNPHHVMEICDLIIERGYDLNIWAYARVELGSEGRHEQTLATDQDNAIVFPDRADVAGETIRERLLPFARSVNRALAACGFAMCKGEIMAGNPRWCLSLSEWQGQFSRWLGEPDGQALLNSTIFFDFRGVAGATVLAERLRIWLADAAKAHDLFRRFMAENALRNEPPLGVLRDFAVTRRDGAEDSLDVKLNGVTPFVGAVRVLSLAAGGEQTGTVERLRDLVARGKLDAQETQAWIDAFHFVQMLRLRHPLAKVSVKRP